MKNLKIKLAITATLVAILVCGCSKDEEPSALKIISVSTDAAVDLNGSAMATNIPLNSSVVVVFDRNVDASTANSNSISIKSNGVDVPSTITVSESTITLKPMANLATGTIQTLFVGSELKAGSGAPADVAEFVFKTFGPPTITPPQVENQLSYFPFSGSMSDAAGTHTPTTADVRDLTYTTDRFGFAGLAGNFNGTTSIVEIPNGELYMANKSFTLSVWIKANSTKAGHFVLGLGVWKGFNLELASDWSWVKFVAQYVDASGLSSSEDNMFAGTGETKDNGGWEGCTFQKNVMPHGGGVGATYFKDKWAQVVHTYDASTKITTLYINGEKVKQQDFNLWPSSDAKRTITGVKFSGNLTGGGNKLALGFIQGSQNRVIMDSWADPSNISSYHFMGLMDDLRIFKAALTAAEVTALYTSEKP